MNWLNCSVCLRNTGGPINTPTIERQRSGRKRKRKSWPLASQNSLTCRRQNFHRWFLDTSPCAKFYLDPIRVFFTDARLRAPSVYSPSRILTQCTSKDAVPPTDVSLRRNITKFNIYTRPPFPENCYFMVALCNRADHIYIHPVSSFFFFFLA